MIAAVFVSGVIAMFVLFTVLAILWVNKSARERGQRLTPAEFLEQAEWPFPATPVKDQDDTSGDGPWPFPKSKE